MDMSNALEASNIIIGLLAGALTFVYRTLSKQIDGNKADIEKQLERTRGEIDSEQTSRVQNIVGIHKKLEDAQADLRREQVITVKAVAYLEGQHTPHHQPKILDS